MKRNLAFTLIAALISASAFAQAPAQAPQISVNGEATVYVQPDKILINLGVETWDMDVVVAKTKNNETVGKAIAAIKALGVAEKDIQTDQISLEPRWELDPATGNQSRKAFLGIFVRNILVVTLGDAAKVETLVTKVLEAGVNYINGINFQSTEFKKHREAARELALKAAKEKAEKMAAVLGESLGRVLQIHDNGGGMPWFNSGWSGGGGRGYAMTQNAIADAGGGGGESGETIALGKIAITANVSVVFELKK